MPKGPGPQDRWAQKTNQTKNQEIHQGYFFIKAESYMSNPICFGIAYLLLVWWKKNTEMVQWASDIEGRG